MIEKLSKTKLALYSSLNRKKMRQKHGLFMIEGEKSIEDILIRYPDKYEIVTILCTRQWRENYHSLIDSEQFLTEGKFTEADESDFRKISTLTTSPSVIAICRLPVIPEAEEILSAPLANDLYLLLDGLQDPGNLGTIVRTAHWFGIKKIFCSPTTVDIYNPKAIQSSMGSLSGVEITYISLPDLIRCNIGIPVIGLQLDGENLFEAHLPDAAMIVMGNEGNGLSDEIRDSLTLSLTIPPYNQFNHSESLNVGVATGITLSQFRR